MNTIFFDIETGPLPADEIAQMIPPFNPDDVKLGNLKDPVKIELKIEEARREHQLLMTENAALDPLTGRVLAIGLLYANGEWEVLGHDSEEALLHAFWAAAADHQGRINQMIGFNIFGFDLPFLVRRSWKYPVVKLPDGLHPGRYWSQNLIDLREVWQLGDRLAKGSLDSIAKHLGVGAKNGDGAQFAHLWATDRPKALEYLRNDVEMTAKVAGRMGVV